MARDNKVYQRCEFCPERPGFVAADRTTTVDGTSTRWAKCRGCGGVGYWPIGLTVGQVERLVEQEQALCGDPGIPQPKASAILANVRVKLARLNRDARPRANARELTPEERSGIPESGVDSSSPPG